MKTIKPFIDMGWHTVPLQGELKRLSNGKKTTPKFPENWKDIGTKDKNTKETNIGGAITGECSGIIAIDCDNTATYELFKALDPDYDFHFVSLGKKDGLEVLQEAGTIIYKYNSAVPDSYQILSNSLALDFLSSGGMTYLPTEGNKTKLAFNPTSELKEAPIAIIALLQQLKPIKVRHEDTALQYKKWRNHLQPQVDRLVKTKKVIPELFKILTPKDFRMLPEYLEKGYLHPDDIPDGGGSQYMSKVSAILGADESIDEELYVDAMKVINDLFSQPMKTVRLNSTIIEPMAEERASINGKPIWQYNESWQEGKLTLITKRNAIIELFFDPRRGTYYLSDTANGVTQSFSKDGDLVAYVEAVALEVPSKKEIKCKLPLVDVTSSPMYEFGFFQGKNGVQAFNTFVPSIPLAIFKDPKSYATQYNRPTTILNYLESFVPDNYMRNYLLKFLRRKFDKFEYSPTMLYFIGASGAGKDTLVNIIERIIGISGIARPKAKEFLEIYNSWIVDKYFVQLDEYGDQLSRFDDKEIAKGLMKGISGKPQISIRQMRMNGYDYTHSVTLIATANKNPLYLDHDDRRVALFNCPNVLRSEAWVQTAGGISTVIDRIETEVNDFAYYLATEIDNLSKDDFTTPPDTEDKKILIASKFNAGDKIAYLLGSGMFMELEKLTREYEDPNKHSKLLDSTAEGRIYEEELFDLYMELTDGKGTKRGLSGAMKEFDKIPTTRNGIKSYYYNIPNLRGFNRSMFDPIESSEVGITLENDDD